MLDFPRWKTIGISIILLLGILFAIPSFLPSKTFDSLPLATCAPSLEERARWINVIDPLLKYAGRPGDWGRDSQLGLLTMRLMQVRAALADASTLPREGGAA